METIRDLCADGHTVVVSIHQPRSSIYALFDDILLLSEGMVRKNIENRDCIAGENLAFVPYENDEKNVVSCVFFWGLFAPIVPQYALLMNHFFAKNSTFS